MVTLRRSLLRKIGAHVFLGAVVWVARSKSDFLELIVERLSFCHHLVADWSSVTLNHFTCLNDMLDGVCVVHELPEGLTWSWELSTFWGGSAFQEWWCAVEALEHVFGAMD